MEGFLQTELLCSDTDNSSVAPFPLMSLSSGMAWIAWSTMPVTWLYRSLELILAHRQNLLRNGKVFQKAFLKASFRNAYTNGLTHELAYDKVCAKILKIQSGVVLGWFGTSMRYTLNTCIGNQNVAKSKTTIATIRVTFRLRRICDGPERGVALPFLSSCEIK